MISLIKVDGVEFIDGGICAAQGFRASGTYCGIKKSPTHDGNDTPVKMKNDICMYVSDTECSAAAVYTQNKVKGAPIKVTKSNLEKTGGKARAVIANSKNANTCNADGEEKAFRMCCLAAEGLGIKPEEVIVASTGVIGQILPIEPIEKAIKPLVDGLSYTGNEEAATAIMTTDTVKKEVAVKFTVGGKECRLGGMAKGSGMIHPNMATTLNFITTDAAVSSEMLQKALSEIVVTTYNCLSVDGDTSTNDMVCVMANGMAGNAEITADCADFDAFKNALYAVMMNMTRMLAKDGEGATKLLECSVKNADSDEIARKIAKSVIGSNLFKAAIFAADANWGRVLCAIGYTDAEFDINKVSVDLCSSKGTIRVCDNGAGVDFSEDTAHEILLEDEITVVVDLHTDKNGTGLAWGCDLTYEYVKINAEYRS